MEIKLENLVPYEKLLAELESVLAMVEENQRVVILKDNLPTYIIQKYDANHSPFSNGSLLNEHYTLHEAMRLVLLEKEDHSMHAADLADEIYERRLYVKKNGEKASYTHVRARCGKYHDMFETLPGNRIKLKIKE